MIAKLLFPWLLGSALAVGFDHGNFHVLNGLNAQSYYSDGGITILGPISTDNGLFQTGGTGVLTLEGLIDYGGVTFNALTSAGATPTISVAVTGSLQLTSIFGDAGQFSVVTADAGYFGALTVNGTASTHQLNTSILSDSTGPNTLLGTGSISATTVTADAGQFSVVTADAGYFSNLCVGSGSCVTAVSGPSYSAKDAVGANTPLVASQCTLLPYLNSLSATYKQYSGIYVPSGQSITLKEWEFSYYDLAGNFAGDVTGYATDGTNVCGATTHPGVNSSSNWYQEAAAFGADAGSCTFTGPDQISLYYGASTSSNVAAVQCSGAIVLGN